MKKRLQWTEPCWRETSRENLRSLWENLSPKRLAAYCLVLPALVLGIAGWWVSAHGIASTLPLPFWKLAAIVEGCCLVQGGMVVASAFIPKDVTVTARYVYIGGVSTPVKKILSLSFAGEGERRAFVVEIQSMRNKVFVRSARLSPRVPEAEIVRFLYDNGLAHLYRT